MKSLNLLILILFNTSIISPSQDLDPSFVFRCIILDEFSKKPIAFAHIYNESRRFGVISDTSGYFATNVRIGDTLAIMALGYLGKSHIITALDTSNTTLFLGARTYQIDEISVEIPRSYKEFKEAFMNVTVNEGMPMAELPKHNPYKTPQLLDTTIISNPAYFIFHPISALYLKYNKQEKSKRKVWYLQQQELKQASVEIKYNRELVSDITSLTDYDLINFMGWCDFSFYYLYESTPLEIVESILAKYDVYIKCCYEGEKSDSLYKGN